MRNMKKRHEKFYKSRLEYNNKWPNGTLNDSSCTILQENFLQMLEKENMTQLFSPLKLKDIDSPAMNVAVSYIIDALDQLPLRPDIAFDQIWRALDYQFHYLKRIRNWKDKNTSLGMMEQTLHELLCDYLRNDKYNTVTKMLQTLASIIPNQTGEYIARRLFVEEGERAASHVRDHQSRIQDRFKNSIFHNDLYKEFESRYESIKNQEQSIRHTKIKKLKDELNFKKNKKNILGKINKLKISDPRSSAVYHTGRLACYLINGETVEFTSKSYALSQEQQMKLIVLGLLYTYRNERFHGSIFSSVFRSSSASLNTYAHAYYMFILAYFILLILIAPILHDESSDYDSLEQVFDEISHNILHNTDQFKKVFSKQIFKPQKIDTKV
ncbi:hypothetical protein P2R64_23610 [Priestia megaterium]|uniref:hypothetical protein n=1 Tax=Priestia megaterium TaxID=1404 RepID=UPI0021BF3259|nr:hypothetical protein [Priestia megaterium]MCT9852289.1 hypothetical protein [Priestia megaterium]MDF1963043.1 hypothetical protein [Priestia megaterium]